MKPKLIFWIDSNFYYFGLAKSLQEMLDCELYSIIEITDKPKKFFKKQQIVNFKKIWFYHDYIKNTNQKPDLKYLQLIDKLEINKKLGGKINLSKEKIDFFLSTSLFSIFQKND